ncbi:MAG: aminopeptidase [Candidatus Cloacimonetes bacterium]|nr:aminopeptidase [Candidatus Cloacimonadota bacterium]MCF7814493.1 aminopeptidase [Candidatus Cloacimonadota bacterium]MCF7867885.1 aminopeptidase [Candidatus Cloacimonadota bacterium]MCF7883704.1 aminopeptidase [Candidatus Cloacimonadota bacterium]
MEDMIEKYSELAFNIVSNLLHIQKDDVVSIAGEIHNVRSNEAALLELPLIEEIAVAIRKRKAFPVLELSTENLKKRFFAEMPEEVFSVPPNYYKSWINSIDIFIEVGWESFASDFKETSDQQIKSFKDSTKSIMEHLFEQKKKLVFLNFPTHELAGYIEKDFEELQSIYLNAVNCNYNLLKIYGGELHDKFFSYSNYRIISKSEELAVKIIKDKIKVYDGDSTKHEIVVIPTGIVEMPIDRESLDGVFFADKIYYKNKTYDNVKIKFENGVVRYVAFTKDKKGNYHMQSEFINSLEECYLTVGFNKNIFTHTNYHSYDRCIDNNVSLKFFDRSFKPIFISCLNAEIEKRM